MFKNTVAFSSFSVDNINKAKKFYGKTLGLKVKEIPEGINVYLVGGAHVFIYPSTDYHVPENTVLNFLVNDIEKTIAQLGKRGVKMEHYRAEFKTDKKGILWGKKGWGPKAIAWFKDPADHIIAIIQEK